MKKFTTLAIAAILALSPLALAQDAAKPVALGARCNGHMCPIARQATQVGHDVVRAQALVCVNAGELLV